MVITSDAMPLLATWSRMVDTITLFISLYKLTVLVYDIFMSYSLKYWRYSSCHGFIRDVAHGSICFLVGASF
jgi:hypothetical protein